MLIMFINFNENFVHLMTQVAFLCNSFLKRHFQSRHAVRCPSAQAATGWEFAVCCRACVQLYKVTDSLGKWGKLRSECEADISLTTTGGFILITPKTTPLSETCDYLNRIYWCKSHPDPWDSDGETQRGQGQGLLKLIHIQKRARSFFVICAVYFVSVHFFLLSLNTLCD